MIKLKELLQTVRIKVKKTSTPTNVIHWVQCASSRDYCPIFPTDSRIIEVKV